MLMKDVSFVPRLKKKLLSISTLYARVAFVDGQVLMWPKGKSFDDAVVIGEQGGLYKLKGQPEQALVHDSVEPNELWHRRISHVHYRALPLASKAIEGLPKIQEKHDGVCKDVQKERIQRIHFEVARVRKNESWKSSTLMYAYQCHQVH